MRRELNELEYFHWCQGQPFNMVAAVQLRGDLKPERLRAALERAQWRHPLLRVNTELGPAGLPRFSSEGVGAIPLAVLDRPEPDGLWRLAEAALETRFAMDAAGSPRLPLIRASLLLPRGPAEPTGLLLTAQHVIADGLSMVFLVRDLLQLIEEPDAPVSVLDAPASPAELLPAAVRRRVPTSPRRFRVALRLARLYVRLRFGRPAPPPRQRTLHHRSWELTPDQTSRLRTRCRREAVSVQSAICTAFLGGFRAIHIPVSLRSLLARPVGESVGLFVGSVEVKMTYRAARGFWSNTRRFHRRFRRALRDPLRIFRIFSKAVPAEAARQLGALLVRMMAGQRPFSISNLGQLDGGGVHLQGRQLKIESFFGAVTSIIDASVVTVYTIEGRLRLHVLANEAGPSETGIREDVERAVKLLLEAIDA